MTTQWATRLPNGAIVTGKGTPNPDADIANEINRLREELEQCRADLKHEHERAEGSEKAFATQFRARQAAENEVEQGFRMFEFAVRLTSYAEREKRLAHGEERAYWQGTCDACRKLTGVFRGQSMFPDLFSELDNTPADEPAGKE